MTTQGQSQLHHGRDRASAGGGDLHAVDAAAAAVKALAGRGITSIPAFKLGGGLRSDWRLFRPVIDEWIATQYDVTRPPLTRGPKPKLS